MLQLFGSILRPNGIRSENGNSIRRLVSFMSIRMHALLRLSNFPSFLAKVNSMQDGEPHGIKNRLSYIWDSELRDIPEIIWTLWHGTTWMTTISLRTILRKFNGIWFHCTWDTTPAKTLNSNMKPEFANLGTILETRWARLESQWNVLSNDSQWIVHMNDSNPTIWTRLNWLKYSNFRQLQNQNCSIVCRTDCVGLVQFHYSLLIMIIIAHCDEVYADHFKRVPKKPSSSYPASAFKAHFVGSCKFALHT